MIVDLNVWTTAIVTFEVIYLDQRVQNNFKKLLSWRLFPLALEISDVGKL